MENIVSNELKAVELWQSYVGPGAPRNAAVEKTGLGWTKEQASELAGHWHNQAPWEKFCKVTLLDHAGPSARSTTEDALAERVFWYLDFQPTLTPAERTALDHFRARRYASAWLALFPRD